MRAVLDPNVVISGLLSPTGTPAEVLRAFDRGEFELVVSRALLEELGRALAYPKLRRHISEEDADAVARWIGDSATTVSEPDQPPPVYSKDPDDDYLVVLASSERVPLVSGDKHLLDLSAEIPVLSPREFLELLSER